MNHDDTSPRSRLVAAVLCAMFGVFGAHRFYLGKTGTGILMVITFGGLGVWTMIDLILILFGVFRDVDGKRVFDWVERQDNLGELAERLTEIEKRITEVQDILISLDDRIQRSTAVRP